MPSPRRGLSRSPRRSHGPRRWLREEALMARFIATVEYEAGEYWISFPGIEKAGSHAKRVEDIVPHARAFLKDWTRYGSLPPVSLDDAIADPTAPFEGTK